MVALVEVSDLSDEVAADLKEQRLLNFFRTDLGFVGFEGFEPEASSRSYLGVSVRHDKRHEQALNVLTNRVRRTGDGTWRQSLMQRGRTNVQGTSGRATALM